ncbi:MAG: DUF3299 domain-containing protein [Planctomycetes bacterium]|nr:DUF3299 domain-containing protein [Planctomycetota bacterium]
MKARRILLMACCLAVLSANAVLGQTVDEKRLKDISFDDVKFDIKKGAPFKRSMLTKEIEAMDGQLIRVRGYMLPSFQQSGIKKFVLVRDNMECCFGPGAAIYDCIIVEMQGSSSASFSVRPLAVEGIFTVSEFKGPDGKHLSVYAIKGRSAK